MWCGALLAIACSGQPRQPDTWHDGPGYHWRELAIPNRGRPGFTAIAPEKSGITLSNDISDSAERANRLLTQGAGVALGDVDGDGLPDVVLGRALGGSRLYHNRGDWTFEDRTTAAGLGSVRGAVTGLLLADFDGDGDLDLLVNALGGPNTLYLNDGTGHFSVDPQFPGLASRLGSTTSTVADIDGDGDLDLYTATYKAYDPGDRYQPEESSFDQVVRQVGAGRLEVVERFRNDFRVDTAPGRSSPVSVRAEPDLLYLNQGGGRFAPAPIRSPRFRGEHGAPIADEPDYFGLAARFYDVNGDGAPDLYVTNDFEDPDELWINDGAGNFSLIEPNALRNTSRATMAVDFGDINRDGLVDLFEVDMLSHDLAHRRASIPNPAPRPSAPGKLFQRAQQGRNELFLNRGDGTFAQIAELAGVDASGWTWATLLLDVDLDGYEDILTATGNRWDFGDIEVIGRIGDPRLNHSMQSAGFPQLAQPNYAFRNRGDLTFEDATDRWHFSAGPDISNAMAVADLDGDGDLDVIVNRLNQKALVLRNDATAPRIAIRLAGRPPNVNGIGAVIRVRGGAVPLQEREVTAGGLYLSHSDYLTTFATGTATHVTIEVRWRDGSVSTISDAAPNRLYRIDQPMAGGAVARDSVARRTPLFQDESERLDHQHVEPPFPEELVRQPLLPFGLSELGPGVTWYDLDQDGDDDLVLGSGRGGSLSWYRNDAGRFVRTDLATSAVGDLTATVGVPGPDGGTRLLVGQSSYEPLTEALTMASVLAIPLDPTGRRAGDVVVAAGPDSASVGPLVVGDVNGDGTLDLFVGGRVLPGEYPKNPGSRLFLNRGGGLFSLDSANAQVLGASGMVSDAVLSDVDRDGDLDLVLALDWGPPRLLLNDHGRFTAGPQWGLDRLSSRWNGIATGDFDGDGRPDLVTTSMGRNVRTQADSARPLLLYYGHFSDDVAIDLLLGRRDEGSSRTSAVTTLGALRRPVPQIAQRFPDPKAFAAASIEEILGSAATAATRLSVNGFDHVVWLNRGDHFEPHPLPIEAQLAPAFAPVVADFDGDGNEDLFLSQNFSYNRGEAPGDAGRGLLLLGDGTGRFTAQPGQVSGLAIYGDQRGAAAADYDQDGRTDLVVSQNAGATRLFRNQGATPGVRVRLVGDRDNPFGIGAEIRLRCGARTGPIRELRGGGGYWSQSSLTPVLGRVGAGCSVLTRWPDGRQTTTAVADGATAVTVRRE